MHNQWYDISCTTLYIVHTELKEFSRNGDIIHEMQLC